MKEHLNKDLQGLSATAFHDAESGFMFLLRSSN